MTTTPKHDPYQALRIKGYLVLLAARSLARVGEQMVGVALGWQVYIKTHNPLSLGLVGLAEALPLILCSLPAGHVTDHSDRKKVAVVTKFLLTLCSLALAVIAWFNLPVWIVYCVIILTGVSGAFSGPSASLLIVEVVPENALANATTWRSNFGQLAGAAGPALGGVVIAVFHGATAQVYMLDVLISTVVIGLLMSLKIQRRAESRREPVSMKSVMEGIHFLRDTPVLLAAITCDLFAVLLGGAVALLPIYARDILHVGPTGLGWMRTMPSIGAAAMAIFIAHRPPFKHAGTTFLFAVAGFGVCTIIFGISRDYVLSLIMLIFMGGLDSVSVVVRSTLMLLKAPDAMRGRVSSVNSIFISASNELGSFESGVTASLIGPIPSVVVGGVGTIAVVVLCALKWPEFRKLGSMDVEKGVAEIATEPAPLS